MSSQLVRQPAATLHVIEPSHLAISIRPHNNPALTLGRPYSFIVTVHDAANNQIFLPDVSVAAEREREGNRGKRGERGRGIESEKERE